MVDENVLLSESNKPGLKKSIGFISGAGIILGTIIGSGIFISPGFVLKSSGSVGMALVVWIISGIISLFGGLCFAELGTAIPKSGAEYNYLLDSFGPLVSFTFLMTSFVIIKPASVTIIAMTSALYISQAFFNNCVVPEILVKLLAASIIILITLINIVSVKWSMKLNMFLNYMKILCILIVTGCGLYSIKEGGLRNFEAPFEGTILTPGGIGYAFYSGLWAYDGWNNLNYAAEEMHDMEKNLPRSIIAGMIMVIVCYFIINLAYIATLGKAGMLQSDAVAITVANKYLGKGFFIIPILVSCSAFGSAISTIFGNGRLLYVAGREGHLPLILSTVHKRFCTPVVSLVSTAVISLFMLIAPSEALEEMIGFFSFATWLYFGLCFLSLVYFRYWRKDIVKPYKVLIAVPVVMAIISFALIILALNDDWKGPLIATGIIFSSIPLYFGFIHFKHKHSRRFTRFIDRITMRIMLIYDLAAAEKEEDMDVK